MARERDGSDRSGRGRAQWPGIGGAARPAALLGLIAALAAGAPAAADPMRVASLLPFVGDALAEIPEHAQLVASARRDLRTPLRDVADLGNPHSPDLEALAAARPELVVGERMLHARLQADLARSGARVLLLDTSGVDATLDGLVELGRQVGDGEALEQRAAAVRGSLGALRLSKPVPVLALFGTPDSFFVITERTWIGDLLVRLGFELPVLTTAESPRFPGFVPVSDELLVTLRPELVLLVAHGDPAALREALARKTAEGGPWSAVGRAATRGVQVLDPQVFGSNPGFGLDRAAKELVALADPASPAAVSAP